MRFHYTATKSDSTKVSGFIDAISLNGAIKELLKKGLYVKKISKAKIGAIKFKPVFFSKISLLEKVLFAKHLGIMIKSGITIIEALKVIEEQAASRRFKKIVSNIDRKIKKGQKISTALSSYPKVFDPLFINIINVGEESGTLEENLEYLAEDLEKKLDLRKKVINALIYPVIVVILIIVVSALIAYFVLPRLNKLFSGLKIDLPLASRIVLKASEIFEAHGGYILLAIVLIPIVFSIIFKFKIFKPILHKAVIRMPIFGNVIRYYNLTLINRTLYILLKSGLTINHSLEITGNVVKNVVYKKNIAEIIKQIEKGEKVSTSMQNIKQSKKHAIFPLLVIKMINVGESSGNLQDSLSYLADYYEKEVDEVTKNLTTILEPILLVIIAAVVLFVALSVILPISQIMKNISSF